MILPKIGITLGDPGGIGPEICVKALAEIDPIPNAEVMLYGSDSVLSRLSQNLDFALNTLPFTLVECELPIQAPDMGQPSVESGQAAFLYFERAFLDAQAGKLQALVTAPISKQSWSLAGIPWPGHTAYFEKKYPNAIMAFFSQKLNVALFTHHIPLKAAIKEINRQALQEFFLRLFKLLDHRSFHITQFLVAGINPHAGESGLLGGEEQAEIIPAIQHAQQQGMPIIGPIPPDIVCREAYDHPDKMVISMYHDQGLIAFKLVSFQDGVNVTLGMPFIRTSPDHGTAFDIAGKNMADPSSMIQAIRLAFELVS